MGENIQNHRRGCLTSTQNSESGLFAGSWIDSPTAQHRRDTERFIRNYASIKAAWTRDNTLRTKLAFDNKTWREKKKQPYWNETSAVTAELLEVSLFGKTE